MPLFVVLDVARSHGAARDLVRKTLRRLLKRCPTEEVALLDPADLMDAELQEGEAADQQQQPLPDVGAGTEHLTQLLAKLNNEERWGRLPNQDTWLRLLDTIRGALSQDAEPYNSSRILLVSDMRKGGGLPPLLRSGQLSNCCVHTVLLSQQNTGHCPVLSALAAATEGTFTAVAADDGGNSSKKPKRPLEGRHSFFPLKKPCHGGKEASTSEDAAAPEPIAMQDAVQLLPEALSSVQFAQLFVGHLTAEVRIAPPLPANLRSRSSHNTREMGADVPGKAASKVSTQASSQLSVLTVLPASKLLHPLSQSTHILCNSSGQQHPLLKLLALSLQGEPRHEPLAAVLSIQGYLAGEHKSECLGLLQLEPGPTQGQGVMLMSMLHPAVHSLDWLERIMCQQPVGLIFRDVLDQLTHDMLKVQRYAKALPSRQQALEQTIATVKAVAATYAAPGLSSVLASALQGVHAEMEEKAAQEQRQRRQHNTRRQAAQVSGTAQALEMLQEALQQLEAPSF